MNVEKGECVMLVVLSSEQICFVSSLNENLIDSKALLCHWCSLELESFMEVIYNVLTFFMQRRSGAGVMHAKARHCCYPHAQVSSDLRKYARH